jgi:aldehyde:ferredoxin oxidoreductase
VPHEGVERLLQRLSPEPTYPTQGRTLFVDLARREVRAAYIPRAVVETFLAGRGSNMYLLYNLLDPALTPLHPDVPLIFGSGILTGIVPSAARGNVSSWSPETHVLMDANAGDYFPSFMKLNGIDHLVLYGRPAEWTYLYIHGGAVEFRDATPWLGLDNIDLRARVAADFGARWVSDLAMASITSAGERQVLCSGIMAGPKSLYARGGPGAKMGALGLKAVVVHGFDPTMGDGLMKGAIKPYNRAIAKKLLDTGVVKHALKLRGTPFLYKPSRVLGAMGTLNNQQNTWTDALDAENLDRWRPDMAGCFRCPVNCRPLNDLTMGDEGHPRGDRYDTGDGPEYVTVGKFGPMIGVDDPRVVLRLNNVANDLGLDTASLGSSIAWAMELYERGLIDREKTGGLELRWGDAATVEKLFFLTARREGFGDVIAASARAVDEGHYPPEALRYRMAVKGLMQSDPHDARIIKAFALGLAVATRGMDHLRNRVTLEINPKINDDPSYKASLYGGPVSAEPNAYDGKARAVRVCEDHFAVGDAVGMCRFTTKLFNSPNLPGMPEFSEQIRNVTGLELSPEALSQVGLNVTGLERMINHALGVRRRDDTLPARWFDEALPWGRYAGEKIDRAAFDRMLGEFYELSGLDPEGAPRLSWRAKLAHVARGFAVTVRLPRELLPAGSGWADGGVVVTEPVASLRDLTKALDRLVPGLGEQLDDSVFGYAINDEVLPLVGRDAVRLKSGDQVEVVPMLAGG